MGTKPGRPIRPGSTLVAGFLTGVGSWLTTERCLERGDLGADIGARARLIPLPFGSLVSELRLPASLGLRLAPAPLAPYLEPQVRLEVAGSGLAAEVAQVAQGVVDGLGTLALGPQPPFELIEHGLAQIVRERGELARRRLPLLGGQPSGVHELG